MLPTKNVALVNLSVCMNHKRKLVPTAIITEEKQMVEWHIKLLETNVRPKHLILLLNLR